MVAPSPQERDHKRTFNQARLAAIRGDALSFPQLDDEEEPVQQTVRGLPNLAPRIFPRDSEDGLLTQLAPVRTPEMNASNEEAVPDPSTFSFLQQQARMAEGIGAPEFLDPETASLPDPEYSTEDEAVTFGESLAAITEEAQAADSFEEAQRARHAFAQKMHQAMYAEAEKLREYLKEQASRLTAKVVGNGSNAVDSVGWDGWITFMLSYIYLMARGLVSIISPENTTPHDLSVFAQGTNYSFQKGLHILIPPYRPLREPGDFLYFLFLLVMSTIILAAIIVIAVLFITFAAFPFFVTNSSPT